MAGVVLVWTLTGGGGWGGEIVLDLGGECGEGCMACLGWVVVDWLELLAAERVSGGWMGT